MPFTVSHAAAVLPFRKLNLVWSAFIVGSMAPDFPYVVGTTEYRSLGHRPPGLLLFTIPVAFAVLWLYHRVIKRPVIDLLPRGVQARLPADAGEFTFAGRMPAISASLLLGIATHIVWDSFTHSFTWAWRNVGWLHRRVEIPFLGAVPGYSALQYISTIIGLLALAIWVWLWYRESPAAAAVPRSRFAVAVVMFSFATVAGFARAAIVVGAPATRARADVFLLVFATTALALAFWQLVLYCVLVSMRQAWTLY